MKIIPRFEIVDNGELHETASGNLCEYSEFIKMKEHADKLVIMLANLSKTISNELGTRRIGYGEELDNTFTWTDIHINDYINSLDISDEGFVHEEKYKHVWRESLLIDYKLDKLRIKYYGN